MHDLWKDEEPVDHYDHTRQRMEYEELGDWGSKPL